KTSNSTTRLPPLSLHDALPIFQAGGIDRFPEYRAQVENAARPAFVLVTDETEPELEHALRLMGISFVERRVAPYVVVIPTSSRVDRKSTRLNSSHQIISYAVFC